MDMIEIMRQRVSLERLRKVIKGFYIAFSLPLAVILIVVQSFVARNGYFDLGEFGILYGIGGFFAAMGFTLLFYGYILGWVLIVAVILHIIYKIKKRKLELDEKQLGKQEE